MCHVMMGNLVMFRKDSVLNILSETHTHTHTVFGQQWTLCPHVSLSCVSTVQSLDWETFEQYSTWQLFLAHSIPLETIIPILQHLKYKGEPRHMIQETSRRRLLSSVLLSSFCPVPLQNIQRPCPVCCCSSAERSTTHQHTLRMCPQASLCP